jgi:hypothetical protein
MRSTPSATQTIAPAAVLDAAERYSSLVGRFTPMSANFDPEAFRLLAPLRRAFASWVGEADSAIAAHELDISHHDLDHLVSAFNAWLENQNQQASALQHCAKGGTIDEVTVIQCLATIGPLVDRGKTLTQKLERARTADPILASLLERITF